MIDDLNAISTHVGTSPGLFVLGKVGKGVEKAAGFKGVLSRRLLLDGQDRLLCSVI